MVAGDVLVGDDAAAGLAEARRDEPARLGEEIGADQHVVGAACRAAPRTVRLARVVRSEGIDDGRHQVGLHFVSGSWRLSQAQAHTRIRSEDGLRQGRVAASRLR